MYPRVFPTLILLAFCFVLVVSCSSKPQFGAAVSDIVSSKTIDILVKIKVADDLNPDLSDRPSPLVLKIYQLTDDEKFISSDINSLLDNDQQALGHTMLKMDRSLVAPSGDLTYELTVNSETTYLGVLAAFQQEGGTVKQTVSLKGGWKKDICIVLDSISLTSVERC